MATPAMGAVAADVYEQLALLAKDDEANGWGIANYVAALFSPLEEVASWVRDTDAGPGFSNLLDLDRAPTSALGWLGQFLGVLPVPTFSDAEQRAGISGPQGFARGSIDAIVAAAQKRLTGAKLVRSIERDGAKANLTIITRTSETPNPAGTEADIRDPSVKPVGIVLTYIVTDTPIINEATRTIDAVAGTVTIDNVALGDV